MITLGTRTVPTCLKASNAEQIKHSHKELVTIKRMKLRSSNDDFVFLVVVIHGIYVHTPLHITLVVCTVLVVCSTEYGLKVHRIVECKNYILPHCNTTHIVKYNGNEIKIHEKSLQERNRIHDEALYCFILISRESLQPTTSLMPTSFLFSSSIVCIFITILSYRLCVLHSHLAQAPVRPKKRNFQLSFLC